MEKFSVTSSGINHNEIPAFHASWFSGEVKDPQDNLNSFYYEGSGENDRLLIYKIEWQDNKPDQELFNCLMDAAITAIDHWISQRF